MLLRIPNRRQKGGGFAVIAIVIAIKMVVTISTENISLEEFLPGVFPILSPELYGLIFSQLCWVSTGAMRNQSTSEFPGTEYQKEELILLIPASLVSPGNPWLRLLLLQKDQMPDSLSRGLTWRPEELETTMPLNHDTFLAYPALHSITPASSKSHINRKSRQRKEINITIY